MAADDDNNDENNLVALPAELHEQICDFLPTTKDLKALRLTSRACHIRTEPVFVARLFANLDIELSVSQAQYLESVTANSKYASQVKRLSIRPLLENYCEQANVDLVRSCLVGALQSLRGLEAVEILPARLSQLPAEIPHPDLPQATSSDERRQQEKLLQAYEDAQRQRDVAVRRWYHTNARYVHPAEPRPISQAFKMVMRAMADAESSTNAFSLPPRTVRFKAGATPQGRGFLRMRNSIAHSVLQWRLMPTAVGQRLEVLHIAVELGPLPTSDHECQTAVLNFLAPCVGLKSLRLEFWGFDVDWLSRTFREMMLPRLEHLHLEAVRRCNAHGLDEFLQRHRQTLRELTLANIHFANGELVPIMSSMLRGLSQHRMTSLHLQQLGYGFGGGLLLFGHDSSRICQECDRDLDALWKFETRPQGCPHAMLKVVKDEVRVKQELDRGGKVSALPYRAAKGTWSRGPELSWGEEHTGDA